VTLDILAKLWPFVFGAGGVVVAALLWRMRGEFATKTDLATARSEIVKLGDHIDGVDNRVKGMERDMQHLPTKDDIHGLHVAVAQMGGELREMRAESRGMRDLVVRTEAVLTRHEDILATAAKAKS
jgi:hypothetical protein